MSSDAIQSIVRPSVTMQSAIMPSVISLNGIMLMLGVIMPSAIIQRPRVAMQSIIESSVEMPNVTMLSAIMPSVTRLNGFMLSVIMPIDIIQSIVRPCHYPVSLAEC
jgi:hypothetical protein